MLPQPSGHADRVGQNNTMALCFQGPAQEEGQTMLLSEQDERGLKRSLLGYCM